VQISSSLISGQHTPDEIVKSIDKLKKYNLMLLAGRWRHMKSLISLEMVLNIFRAFFSKPEVIEGRDISPAKINLLQIMAE
jgi:hypothetical protein